MTTTGKGGDEAKLHRKQATLAEAAALADANPRSLQFWTANGVVECTPDTMHGGPGVKRKYEAKEIAIASLVNKIAAASVSVGELRRISSKLRESYRFRDECDAIPDVPGVLADISRDQRDALHYGMLFNTAFDDNDDFTTYMILRRSGDSEWNVNIGMSSNNHVNLKEFDVDSVHDISEPNNWGITVVFNLTGLFSKIRAWINQ